MKKLSLAPLMLGILTSVTATASTQKLVPLAGAYEGIDAGGRACRLTIQSDLPQRDEGALDYQSSRYLLSGSISDHAERSCKYAVQQNGSILSLRTYSHDEVTTFYQVDLALSSNAAQPIQSATIKFAGGLTDWLACMALSSRPQTADTCSNLRKIQ